MINLKQLVLNDCKNLTPNCFDFFYKSDFMRNIEQIEMEESIKDQPDTSIIKKKIKQEFNVVKGFFKQKLNFFEK